jgi:hypothetical protein
MWNFYHIYILIYVVYTTEPQYIENVEGHIYILIYEVYTTEPQYIENVVGHIQYTCYKLFHIIESVLRKYVTRKYYSFLLKNLANMQYKIGAQTPSLSL